MLNKRFGICCANTYGIEILKYVVAMKENILFVATNPDDNQNYEEEIAKLCIDAKIPLLRKVLTSSEQFYKFVKNLDLDLIFLTWWPSIIKKEELNLVKEGWVNMHPSLLPYGRGKHPYYWSIVENLPFGVSLHFIDEGIDTGPVIAQKEIKILPEDNGESLYNKAINEIIKLFKENFIRIISSEIKPIPQNSEEATFHLAKELEPHSCINLDTTYKGRDLINILRARTFENGKKSSYFIIDGKRYNIKISIKPED